MVMKGGMCRLLAALPCLALTAQASASDLSVSGRIESGSVGSECVAQLVRPGAIVAERPVSGSFNVRFSAEGTGGAYLVDLVCGGYRVYTSHPIDLTSRSQVLTVGTIHADRPLDSDGCRQLRGQEAEAAVQPMRLAFEKERDIPLAKISFGPPMACSKETYVIVEALDEFSGPGMHWIISTSAVDGRTRVVRGL